MFTLTKLEDALETFKSNHYQLKSFYLDKIPAVGESSAPIYPMLFGAVGKASTSDGQRILRVKFWVMDKVREDKSNQNKVLSDTELIVLDLLSYFKQTRFDEHVNIEVNNDYDPFTEGFDDNCSGWEIEVKFKTIFEWDLCSVPASGITTPNPYFGKVVIRDQDNNVIAVLSPNEEYTVTIVSAIDGGNATTVFTNTVIGN